ncbi:hypothetical protein B0H13DRAFT_2380350 [Mycena leptocephala]|nr:hypothetical protein B0H13DRAFT_2380350 [Mycena leptocephala]
MIGEVEPQSRCLEAVHLNQYRRGSQQDHIQAGPKQYQAWAVHEDINEPREYLTPGERPPGRPPKKTAKPKAPTKLIVKIPCLHNKSASPLSNSESDVISTPEKQSSVDIDDEIELVHAATEGLLGLDGHKHAKASTEEGEDLDDDYEDKLYSEEEEEHQEDGEDNNENNTQSDDADFDLDFIVPVGGGATDTTTLSSNISWKGADAAAPRVLNTPVHVVPPFSAVLTETVACQNRGTKRVHLVPNNAAEYGLVDLYTVDPRERGEKVRVLALFDSGLQVGAMDKGFFETVKRKLGKVNAPTKHLKMADGTLVDSVAHWEGLIEIGGARTHGGFEVFDSRGAWLSGAACIEFPPLSTCYPLWIESPLFNIQVYLKKRARWEQASEWLAQKSRGIPSLAGAQDCLDTFDFLPWDTVIPGLSPPVHLATEDLALFLSSECLNDEMINAGVDYILQQLGPGSRIFILNCLFIQSLRNARASGSGYNLARYSAGLVDILWFPLHVSGNHWTLLKIDLVSKTIAYSDSWKMWMRKIRETLDTDFDRDPTTFPTTPEPSSDDGGFMSHSSSPFDSRSTSPNLPDPTPTDETLEDT